MKRLPMLALFALDPKHPLRAGEAPPTPTDVKPGSITCEDVPYPYPVSYMPLTLYGQTSGWRIWMCRRRASRETAGPSCCFTA